ncbi:MAG: ferredoxin [Bdellovibrionales bacterium]|nr:ferredoxin [Bdellovibrionales bacterium]
MSLWSPEKILRIAPGCIVCKTCEYLAPDLFELQEKALTAEVLVPYPSAEQMEELKEAIRNCPVYVIQYRKQET